MRLVAIGVVAWLVGWLASVLVGAFLTPPPRVRVVAPADSTPPPDRRLVSLDRLFGATPALDVPRPPPGPPPEPLRLELRATLVSTHPALSNALVFEPGASALHTVRPGDALGTARVEAILREPARVGLREASGELRWIEFGGASPLPPIPFAAVPPPATRDRLAARITGDGFERRIPSSVRDELLSSPEGLAREIRGVPVLEGGSLSGFRVLWVRPGSALEALGAKAGDVVRRVNGTALDSRGALDAWSTATSVRAFDLELERGGKPSHLRWTIE